MRSITIENILATEEWRDNINKTPLKEIEFLDENGNVVNIDEEIYRQWKFAGLNNIDFIKTGFYKQGFIGKNKD